MGLTKFEEALESYNKQEFDKAFGIFLELANKDDAKAAYYLARMYQKGEGTVIDNQRYDFWIKKAADAGISEASIMYSMTLINNANGDIKIINEGMKYLQEAADANNKDAIEKYIETANCKHVSQDHIKKAIEYCTTLEEQQTDAYDKQQYTNRLENLNQKLGAVKKSSDFIRIQTIFKIAGPILLVIGFFYLFGGLHPQEWEDNTLLKFFPNIGRFLILPIYFAWKPLDGAITIGINGKFGLELIAIAYTLIYISMPGKKFRKKYYLKSVYSVSKLIIATITIWHILLQLLDENEVFAGMFALIIAIVICNIIGRLIGFIVNRIILKQK